MQSFTYTEQYSWYYVISITRVWCHGLVHIFVVTGTASAHRRYKVYDEEGLIKQACKVEMWVFLLFGCCYVHACQTICIHITLKFQKYLPLLFVEWFVIVTSVWLMKDFGTNWTLKPLNETVNKEWVSHWAGSPSELWIVSRFVYLISSSTLRPAENFILCLLSVEQNLLRRTQWEWRVMRI